MKKSEHIYKRTWFFYKGALVIQAPKIVNWMSCKSGMTKKNELEAVVICWPLVFASRLEDFTERIARHEVNHTRQIFDCMMLGFGISYFYDMHCLEIVLMTLSGILIWQILYILEFLILRCFFKHHDAYLLVCYEQEALLNEKRKGYLYWRIPFTWVLYLVKNILLLPFRCYRVILLRKLVHLRMERKKYFYCSFKKIT